MGNTINTAELKYKVKPTV